MRQSPFILIVSTICAMLLPVIAYANQKASMNDRAALDSATSELRLAKNARYNGGKCDIMAATNERGCFFDQHEPVLSTIPWEESDIICIGKVLNIESYLSIDRTHIYTETIINVSQLLKSPKDFKISPDQTLIADQLGGAIKFKDGRVITDGTRDGFMGRAYVKGRYAFFLRRINGGKEIGILRAYEIRNGKVFKLTEDGRPGKIMLPTGSNKAKSFFDEQMFIRELSARPHDPN
jgi:hypothetical protein